MEQYKLAEEIIKMCKYFKIINYEEDNQLIKKKITEGLDDIIFVENLLNILYKKMNLKEFQKNLNKKRLKKLLIELEKIRLNLEFN